MKSFWPKIQRKLLHLRLQPIRVFCFHQTSEQYDPDVYCKPDWIPLDFLKKYLILLQQEGYEFISLSEAHRHLKNDKFRFKKFAVLTADDGLKCQLDLLLWLESKQIPVTLFVNTETLDGKTCGEQIKQYFKINTTEDEVRHAQALYITKDQLFSTSSPNLSIGMHGVTHKKITELTADEFAAQLQECRSELAAHPCFVDIYAYPHGNHNKKYDDILTSKGIIPVLADGEKNYNDSSVIHREIMEYIYKCQNRQS